MKTAFLVVLLVSAAHASPPAPPNFARTFFPMGAVIILDPQGPGGPTISSPSAGSCGTGTANTIMKFTGTGTTCGNSSLTDNGTTVTGTEPLLLPDGSSATPSFAFSGATNTGWYRTSTILMAVIAGTDRLAIQSNGLNWNTNKFFVDTLGDVLTANGKSTAGATGYVTTYANGRATAQVAANASVSTVTAPAVDGDWEVSANVNVTAATTASFSVTCTYTDETNTSRTLTFGFTQLSGATFLTVITNVTGTGPYESPSYHIRVKASTAITIATTGTFTSVTYNISGVIRQTS